MHERIHSRCGSSCSSISAELPLPPQKLLPEVFAAVFSAAAGLSGTAGQGHHIRVQQMRSIQEAETCMSTLVDWASLQQQLGRCPYAPLKLFPK